MEVSKHFRGARSAPMLAALLVAAAGSTAASAQDWRRDPFKYEKEPHSFGPHCAYRIIAQGTAPVTLFGGVRENLKAEAHAIQDWEKEVIRLLGLAYAKWELAAGKDVRCVMVGNDLKCIAAANPCMPHH